MYSTSGNVFLSKIHFFFFTIIFRSVEKVKQASFIDMKECLLCIVLFGIEVHRLIKFSCYRTLESKKKNAQISNIVIFKINISTKNTVKIHV